MEPSDTPRRKPSYKPFEAKFYSAHDENALPSMPGRFFRLGDELAGATIFEVDSQLELYRQEKENHRPWDNERDRDALTEAERQAVVTRLRRDAAAHAPLRAALKNAQGLDELVALIQEDLVVMRKREDDRAEDARAVYVNVSFPSGWCPPCVRSAGFSEIHARVPEDGTFTHQRRGALAEHLWPTQAPKVRFVWTLTPGSELSRQHCHKNLHHTARLCSWEEATNCFLRVERQVIVKIDARLSAFLIRVYVHELEALDADEQRNLLHAVEAIARNESVARYKGFGANLGKIRTCFLDRQAPARCHAPVR
jgi:hypothetical protein